MKFTKQNAFKALIFILVFALAATFLFDINLFDTKKSVSYNEFYSLIESNQIEKVTFQDDWITFKKTDDKSTYKTQNPDSPNLKEHLLQNNISYSVKKDETEVISLIFDIIFYAFFFGIIAFVFGKFVSPNTFKVLHKTGKTFDDVVGMDRLKNDMKQICDIMQNPKKYQNKGIRLPKGVLLEGEPGNGKTLFAKAMAGEAKVNFIPAKATDFESMFMAIGPMKVKLLFKKARKMAPCIVFIDEFDGIGTRRNYSGSAIETENTRIVTALLNELDGFQPNSGILVLAATNNSSALDEALIRPGRFDAKFTIPYPNQKERIELIHMYSKGKTFNSNITPSSLATKFEGFSCAKIESILNKSALLASQNNKNEITIEEINQAMEEL